MITFKGIRKLYIINVYFVTNIAEDIVHTDIFYSFLKLYNKHHLTKTSSTKQ